MASSINSYSVRLGMDASGFVDGAKLSRFEAKALSRDIDSIKDPMDRFAEKQNLYAKALASGSIDQAKYNKLMSAAAPASAGFAAALGPVGVAISAVAVGLTAAGVAGTTFVGFMRTIQNRIDDTADKAERLGFSLSELGALKFGFAEGGGIDESTVENTLAKLQVNVAKAIDGDAGLRGSFAKLGIDAGSLMADGPQQAMLKIAEGMERISGHGERMKISMELFGKSGVELASTLGKGSEALQEAFAFQQKWASLTDTQVAGVGNLNDSIGRVSVIISGITDKVAAELAPAFQIVSDAFLDGAKNVDGIDLAIKNGVTTATILVGVFMDGLEVIQEIGTRWQAINRLDFAAATKSMDPAVLDLDQSRKLYAELEKNRAQAKLDGIEAAARREAEKQAKTLEATEEENKLKLKGIEEAAKEEKRRQEEAERAQRSLAERALQAAEQAFEKEVARQQKLREDVAKGPGAGIEAGSAEAAKFMADQANQAIADSAVKDPKQQTEEELLAEARKQLEFLQQDAKTKDGKLDKLVDTLNDQGWEAV